MPVTSLPEALARKSALPLPELSETEISRHYTALANRAHGVNNGFYPLGSCTMKYNPRINDEMANQAGFVAVHPLQPKETVQGCTEALELLDKYLCEITGMDKMDFQPAAGAHGEFTGLLLIKKYHEPTAIPNAPKLSFRTARTALTRPALPWRALPRLTCPPMRMAA